MKYIVTIIKNLFLKDLPKPLGRWKIDYCNNKINNKIDLSNEDHCGPCGQYGLNKIELHKGIKKNEKTYIHLKNLKKKK